MRVRGDWTSPASGKPDCCCGFDACRATPDHAYWHDRKLALHIALLTAEPFYYSDGQLRTWRATQLLAAVDCEQAKNTPNFGDAIIAPVHLPRGLVGAVFWCSRERFDQIAPARSRIVGEVTLHAVAQHLLLVAQRQVGGGDGIGHVASPATVMRHPTDGV